MSLFQSVLNRSMAASLALVLAAGLLLASQTGCMLYANLMHAVGADRVPPDYDGLEDTRLAIVTVTSGSQYSDDVSAKQLSQLVGNIVLKEVDGLKLVREDEIEQWRDTHGWDSIDFREIARGVEADKVLGIELSNLKLRDGATLYRGRSDVSISVIDAETGAIEYRRSLDEFTYPNNAPQPQSETTETRFRKLYLGMLAKQIARSFHPWDLNEDFANDSIIASH